MIFYMIRHKATGEFMPELKRGRGYSHWNPSTKETSHWNTITGSPRLLASIKKAKACIAQWNALPNSMMSHSTSYNGEDDYSIYTKPDGRTKEDLEVVMVNIEEIEVIK